MYTVNCTKTNRKLTEDPNAPLEGLRLPFPARLFKRLVVRERNREARWGMQRMNIHGMAYIAPSEIINVSSMY